MIKSNQAAKYARAYALGAVLLVTLVGSASAADRSTTLTDSVRPVKIYVFAGQSNMEARYPRKFLEEKHPELVKDLGIWGVQGCHRGPFAKAGSFGTDRAMIYHIAGQVDQPIIVFRCAQGGTNLHRQWRPPSAVKRAGGKVGVLYKRLISRFHNMIANLKEVYPAYKGQGYEIAAFVWFQGESDSCGHEKVDGKRVGYYTSYEANLRDLIKDVRHDLGVANLPVMIPQINVSGPWEGKVTITGKDGKPQKTTAGQIVRDAQAKVAESTPHCKWVETKGLAKGYHYDASAYVVIGKRMGQAMAELAQKVQPADPEKVAKAYQQFRAREYIDAKPDTTTLHKGLICYFPFDEGTGDVAMDRSPRGLKGKLIPFITKEKKVHAPEWVQGIRGKALRFRDGKRVEVPDYRDPADGEGKIDRISISYWINKTTCDNGVHVGRGSKSKKIGWEFQEYARRNQPEMWLGTENRGVQWRGPYGVANTRTDGYEWHHMALVFDGPNQRLNYYFNGVKYGLGKTWIKEDGKKKLVDRAPSSWQIKAAPPKTPLIIGRQVGRVPGFQAIDEVMIWDRALSDEEISKLYNNGLGVSLRTEGE